MLESAIEAILVKEVKERGGMAVKLQTMVVGTPDRLILMPDGRFYLVELKTLSGELEPAQVYWHEKAGRLGHEVVVLYGADEVRTWARGLP